MTVPIPQLTLLYARSSKTVNGDVRELAQRLSMNREGVHKHRRIYFRRGGVCTARNRSPAPGPRARLGSIIGGSVSEPHT